MLTVDRAPLRAPPGRADPGEAGLRVGVAAIGATPVTLVAAAAFGVADLRTLAIRVLVPMAALAGAFLIRQRRAVRLLPAAVAGGLAATFLYDAFRFGFLGAGWIDGDPIPHIGEALQLHPAWVVGYVWRYLGNGTGLALAFLALGLRGVRSGIVYGLCVLAGLLVTLVISPYGEQMLFPLTLPTVAMATGGHVIYGAVLGWIATRPRVESLTLGPRKGRGVRESSSG